MFDPGGSRSSPGSRSSCARVGAGAPSGSGCRWVGLHRAGRGRRPEPDDHVEDPQHPRGAATSLSRDRETGLVLPRLRPDRPRRPGRRRLAGAGLTLRPPAGGGTQTGESGRAGRHARPRPDLRGRGRGRDRRLSAGWQGRQVSVPRRRPARPYVAFSPADEARRPWWGRDGGRTPAHRLSPRSPRSPGWRSWALDGGGRRGLRRVPRGSSTSSAWASRRRQLRSPRWRS